MVKPRRTSADGREPEEGRLAESPAGVLGWCANRGDTVTRPTWKSSMSCTAASRASASATLTFAISTWACTSLRRSKVMTSYSASTCSFVIPRCRSNKSASCISGPSDATRCKHDHKVMVRERLRRQMRHSNDPGTEAHFHPVSTFIFAGLHMLHHRPHFRLERQKRRT